MKNVILVRFNEIHLKGGNKKYFTRLLYNNMRDALVGIDCKVENGVNRLIVRDYADEDLIVDKLKFVFGVHSVSPAVEVDNNKEEIEKCVLGLNFEGGFKCRVNRADKSFPVRSNDFAADLGELILNNKKQVFVDIHCPLVVVNVDIRETGKTYIYTKTIYAYSGLPLSEHRDGLLLLSGGIDSPVAGFCMAKRGLRQDLLHFDSFPYTSKQAKQKVIDIAHSIKDIIGAKYMYICSMTKMQEEFHVNCKQEYAINLLRRAMIRVANALCSKFSYKTIITGESLGQVASQTIESLTSTNSVAEYPVLRPLISLNKSEIIEMAKDINTYDLSILPYEDCCTVFLPRNPITKPKVSDAEQEENKIPYNELLNAVINSIEVIEL